jgi:hypothetical protein
MALLKRGKPIQQMTMPVTKPPKKTIISFSSKIYLFLAHIMPLPAGYYLLTTQGEAFG